MKAYGSTRLGSLGSAIFAEVAQWRREAEERGVDVIDLGIGSPDLPPSPRVIEALAEAVKNPQAYGYPGSEGTPEFRRAAAGWMHRRFGVALDPQREVLALMGSQDGLAHLAMALCNPGDTALVPDPGYPIYAASLVLAGVQPVLMPLKESNGFLPQLESIPPETAEKASFLLLSYPGNPIPEAADRAFYEKALAFAERYDLLIVHDLAYSELAFEGYKPMSILELDGAKKRAVEFHSLSKSFNMAGCRIAFLAGNAEAVDALRRLKSNIDYGVFLPVQQAAVVALEEETSFPSSISAVYEQRRDALVDGLRRIGWHVPRPKATMFVWAKIPQGWTSRHISQEILERAGVAVIPGDAFGAEGEGYVRIALVQPEERLREAVSRIGEIWQSVSEREKNT
ncbi:aminotransferase class I/II-fold pyridoxal phosphate-dependent enzyme [Paenibacillus chitinolyticus]|uniref:aminotransferase class I/II-fold pyridoxal phosphate-dependent enzyme n=1 Tax=Paenibacillus chitinolyticus TaxID=79263 RepID=UPI002DB57927|nr:aminotransferase class I/II-fold pyridoxal phosphate-dependent enzyme [Paenibacillus chitinolyticus]MEC0246747.1 aminotransferase class I/II-fold pyridoxal phosphate-dependent enzyme [Paenibacillus chitinolyticus]